MGNLVDLLRGNQAPTELTAKNWSLSPVSNDRVEPLQPSPHRDTTDTKSASWTFPFVFRNLTRFTRGMAKQAPHPSPDAYTLVLLADQELTAGRDSQAKTLLAAAYAAYDRQANCRSDAAANQP